MATYDREAIARCLFETAMTGHAQWDQMSEPNKDDWRAKADVWISEVTILIEDRARRNTPLSQCGHPDCKT